MTPEAATAAKHVLDGWHEFYLLAGTAAVTLVGLLFVSLSFNLDVLLHDSRQHLLAAARETLISFVYVLIISLMFLIPDQGPHRLGFSIGLTSVVMLALSVAGAIRARRWKDPSQHTRGITVRRRLLLVAYLMATAIGVAMFVTRDPYWSYSMIGVICLLLGNAAGSSWELLVSVARLKRELEKGA